MDPFLKPIFIYLFTITVQPAIGQTENMALIEGGTFIPLYGTDSAMVKVNDFYLDLYPVTHSEFLTFSKAHPEWQRSKVKALFADGNYLVQWESDSALGAKPIPNGPVTNVSWFAAKKYCDCLGKRLPTVDEWEYAAMANEEQADARTIESYNQYILEWYEAPKSFNKPIGSTFKNFWGVYDLHGLVWEWTSDFNSVLISGESRNDVDKDSNLFCGSAAVGASDLMNYAAFMRYAFRGSIKANYAIKNLGFRCAKDGETVP